MFVQKVNGKDSKMAFDSLEFITFDLSLNDKGK
jgi:hypothetical protein